MRTSSLKKTCLKKPPPDIDFQKGETDRLILSRRKAGISLQFSSGLLLRRGAAGLLIRKSIEY